VAHESEEALRMMQALPVPKGVEFLSGAGDYLLARPEVTSKTVGSVGFCMGGGFLLYQAAADPRVSAAVPFYGVIRGELPDFSGLKAEVLGHYGEHDASIPVESLEPLREAIKGQSGITPDLRVYRSNHAFFNDARPVYDAESAALAWERARCRS
jgi:carboxymethylenebutenolidase